MIYAVNGNTVTTTVMTGQPIATSYQLGCSKTVYQAPMVLFTAIVYTSGEILHFTDSLAVGNYTYTGIYGDMFVLSYNGTDNCT
jgi:hypothetical protein